MEQKIVKVTKPITRLEHVRSIGVIGDPGCEDLGTYNMKVYAGALEETGKDGITLIVGDLVPAGTGRHYRAIQELTEALAENLKEIAPYAELEKHTLRVDEDNGTALLREADVICEAFDDAECKAMLVNLVLEHMPDKYLVAASGMAGMGKPNRITTRRVAKRFYLCGDGISDAADGIGLVAPRVMVCAAHQAQTVLRILAGKLDV